MAARWSVGHAAMKLIPSMKADKIVAWGDSGDAEAEAVRNLALAVEQNYGKNARSSPICFGLRLPPPRALASP